MAGICWKCNQKVETPVHFKTVCEKCLAYLHCCLGCQYYSQGKPNHCLIPGTEPVRDRESANYCDEYKVKNTQEEKKGPSIDDVSKRLFKDED